MRASLIFILFAAEACVPYFATRIRFKAAEASQVNSVGQEWPDWLGGFLFKKPSTRCADIAGNWAQAGDVWEASSEGVRQYPVNPHEQPCSKSGWAVHKHGDNTVEFVNDGHFLHVTGHEVGNGAGATICDLASKPAELEYVYTDGLAGCMGLSIIGSRKGGGARDMFFCHSRKWSDYRRDVKKIPANDPLYAARDFVRNHENLHIFYGSGDHVLNRDGHFNPASEAWILSQILGVWVQSDSYHMLAFQSVLAFSLQHEAWVPLSGQEEIVRMFSDEEKHNGTASAYLAPYFVPDQELIWEIAMLKVPKKHAGACINILRACAAGDYAVVRSLFQDRDVDVGKLDPLLERCYKDLVGKGYEDQYSQRLQFDFGRVGRHMISTPRKP